MRSIIKYLPVIGLSLLFAGCSVFTPSRPSDTNVSPSDFNIQSNLSAKLGNSDNFPDSNIYALVYNGRVLLTGQVLDEDLRKYMLNVARGYPGVTKIYDYTETRLPVSFSIKSSDAGLTTAVKSKLFAAKDMPSGNIKVETTNSVVYLLGDVTRAQGESAASMTSVIGGVQKVVTLFDYTN